jgi:phosphomannomutase/phosphoglucomutase
MSLFGTSGIRGDAKELFTNQFSFDLGRTFAIFLSNHKQNGPVAIGMDPRESSPRIKKAIISGLVFEKRQVCDQGVAPIPSLNYILKASLEYAGSIMVTGSHIKAHLNGVKFFAFGEEILKEHEAEIEQIYSSIKEKVPFDEFDLKMVVYEEKAKEEYINYLISKANRSYPKWKIVVDAGNGAQSDVAPYVLKYLGFDVIELNTSIQEDLLSRDTEVEGDFADLQEKVRETKADFGVGYDSDGDRCIFVDEKGNFIPGDYTGALIASKISSDSVVTPINTSQVVEEVCRKVYRTKVGSPYVVAKMKETKSNFGFEANGGGIFSEIHSRDGGRTTIEVLNILSESKTSLSNLISKMPQYFLARDKVDYKWELRDKIIDEARNLFKGVKVDETDGLKIWLDDKNWILFRSSQNAPEFRVFAESPSRSKARSLLLDGVNLVRKIVNLQND